MSDTIYQIRELIIERKRGGKSETIVDKIRTVVGNLKTAEEIFKDMKNDAECYFQYGKYHGWVKLFIPEIHDNGELKYFGEEIEVYKKDEK